MIEKEKDDTYIEECKRKKHHEKQRYSIRKYAFGVASVLIGCAYMANAQVAHADQTTAAPVAESTTTSTNVSPTQPATTVDTTTSAFLFLFRLYLS